MSFKRFFVFSTFTDIEGLMSILLSHPNLYSPGERWEALKHNKLVQSVLSFFRVEEEEVLNIQVWICGICSETWASNTSSAPIHFLSGFLCQTLHAYFQDVNTVSYSTEEEVVLFDWRHFPSGGNGTCEFISGPVIEPAATPYIRRILLVPLNPAGRSPPSVCLSGVQL